MKRKVSDIGELHDMLMMIARQFHTICSENHIPYYMLYGTMLGAKRHQGFIPWDDDMDFGIERRYYDQLVDALRTSLPSPYQLITRNDRGGAVGGYLKIVNTNTSIKEQNKLHDEDNTGLFIDIFLLYNEKERSSLRQLAIKMLLVIQHFRFYRLMTSNPVKRVVDKLIKLFFFWLKQNQIIDVIEKLLIPANLGGYFSTYSSIYGKMDIIPQQYYGKPKLYKFEDIDLYGVEDADAYLRQLYGDYMKLPPEDKRKVHMQEVYIERLG